ncbi:hypothetical protein E3N88_00416 [Mikania micrantha]|uniref:Uncharacterized protein n=1 Tax=Mikania micrantha TaxID=192012 RepID=A0A5N6Q0Q4_9ASTR|nr:hypothetical protein E3N88_00416 [Mikania micrantha]
MMEQNWNPYFKFWFYDEKTAEAVILFKQEDQWRVIRMLDPVWIVNCSKDDIDLLIMAEIFDAEGCNWEDVNYLYVELMKVQKEIVTPRAGGLDRLSRRAESSRGTISFDNRNDQIVYIAHEI